MEMRLRYKAAIIGGALLTSFAFGRYSAPVKIKTETKEVDTKHEVEDKTANQNKHKETVITETVKPDGTKEKVTKTIEDTHKQTDSTDTTQTDSSKTETKEVTKEGRKVILSALGGVGVSSGHWAPVYGLSAQSTLVGPITVGAFGLTTGVVGCSLGLMF